MIDLHLHTTASDGSCTPTQLVQRARDAGIEVLAVADHDTVAAVSETASLAEGAGLCSVAGVEITAVHDGKDVHILGYFVDVTSPVLLAFLEDGRRDRFRRATAMCDRLAALGAPVDLESLIERSGGPNSGKSIARPTVAKALVDAGHVETVQEAFDRFLAEGKPAYCPRMGASPRDVVSLIAEAGGIASLAHPGPLGKDGLIDSLAAEGLGALECFHSDHDEATTGRYLSIARRLGLAVTGGSDFHGPASRRADAFGRVGLPVEHYQHLLDRAGKPRSGFPQTEDRRPKTTRPRASAQQV
jgi:predicted metal-dependent phosphoesterase TrpH